MSRPVLDLTRYAFCRQLGDITIYGSWIGASVDESEPCLVLVPTYRIGVDRCCPVVVALSAAYRYADPNYLLQRSIQFNRTLGFSDSASHVHKVASIIYDHLQDLVELPPKPVERATVGAEATLVDAAGRTLHAEILDLE